MPVYQYVCSKCNTNFELRQSFNDDSIVNCPKCMSQSRRLFIPVPIIFKGSGFYVTDHKKNSEAQLPPKEKQPEAAADLSKSKSEKADKPISAVKNAE